MHDVCSRCGVEANLSSGNYSDNALAALIVWGEMTAAQVEAGVCEFCHQEAREVLMERADELSDQGFATRVAEGSVETTYAAVGGEPIYPVTRALSGVDLSASSLSGLAQSKSMQAGKPKKVSNHSVAKSKERGLSPQQPSVQSVKQTAKADSAKLPEQLAVKIEKPKTMVKEKAPLPAALQKHRSLRAL